MGNSLTVLFSLLLRVQKLPKKEKSKCICKIMDLLIDLGIITVEDIKKEEKAFMNFVKSISHYINDQQLSEDDAVKLASRRYPQFDFKNLAN